MRNNRADFSIFKIKYAESSHIEKNTLLLYSMKNLARHIELLLRNNDCVILPGFGGFIAHAVPAYYVSEEHLYYPPSRGISFNASLTMNDGLLVQSYMQSYQVDYAKATYMVDMALDKLLDTLDEESTATLPHIGTLRQDIYGTIQFQPETAGVDSPSYFGLSSFFVQDLATLIQRSQTISVAQQSESPTTHEKKTIELHIDKGLIRHIMSTAAILLLLLTVSLPIGREKPTDIASLDLTVISTPLPAATVQAEEVTPTDMPDTTLQIVPMAIPVAEDPEVIVPTEEAMPAPQQAEALAPATTDQTAEVPVATTPAKQYHIIVASLASHHGAEETLAQYVAKGYPEASLVERDNRVRISLTHFTSKDAANEYLKVLRTTDKAFQNAWLLAVRNN